jgi:hypothetical protein
MAAEEKPGMGDCLAGSAARAEAAAGPRFRRRWTQISRNDAEEKPGRGGGLKVGYPWVRVLG